MEVVQSGMTEPGTGTWSFELCWRRPDRVDKSGLVKPDGKRRIKEESGRDG